MGVLSESLSATDWALVETLDTRHPDRAMSYEIVPEGFLVRMWTIDNTNDTNYGPFAIKPEHRTRVEHYVNELNRMPCPLGESCPSQGIPKQSMAPGDWDALNSAVHQNHETCYDMLPDGLAVRRRDDDGKESVIWGPLAIKAKYRRVVPDFVHATQAHTREISLAR